MAEEEEPKKDDIRTLGEIEKMAVDQQWMEDIEAEVQTLSTELSKEKALEQFRNEYINLYKVAKNSYEKEKQLLKRCRELNQDLCQNIQNLRTALKSTQSDAEHIMNLKKEVDKKWKVVDTMKERELNRKMQIEQNNEDIAKIKRLIDQPENIILDEHKTLKRLLQEKEDKVKECDDIKNTYSAHIDIEKSLTQKLTGLSEEESGLNKDLSSIEASIEEAKQSTKTNDEKRIELENDLKNMKLKNEENIKRVKELGIETKSLKAECEEKKREAEAHEEMLKMLKDEIHEFQKKSEAINKDIASSQKQITVTSQNVAKQADEIEKHLENIDNLEKTIAQEQKNRQALYIKVNEAHKEKDELELERSKVKTKIDMIEAEIAKLKAEVEDGRKQIEEKMRMRELLNKKVVKAEDEVKKQDSAVKIFENEKLKLDNEDKAYRAEIAKLDKIINQLEEAKKKYGVDAAQANAKYYQHMEELKYKNDTITDLQRKNAETEAKYKQQQNLLDAVKTDKNLYCKNYNEAKEEIEELGKRHRQMRHQIDLLKEEIKSKDTSLLSVNRELQASTKDYENLCNDIENQNVRKTGSENMLKTHEIEITKLKGVILQVEETRLRQKKDYDMVVSERDILGNQLIKRNEELVLLYEKIKIQQSTLAKGNIRYKEKCSDVEALKTRISEINAEIGASEKEVAEIESLQKEIHKLGKELIDERLKSRALSDELSKPMNIHQWRQLEGTEPEIYQMLMKVHSLQRNLIAKTEELAEKDILIQEKEKLYVELKNILAKQSGPEVAEKLVLYQENLKERNKQLKQYVEELEVYRSQVNAYKFEIERINGEISKLREQYFNQKKTQDMAVIPEDQKEAA